MKSATIIGSGNVATHLAKQLFAKGCNITQIFSRSLTNAQTLANAVNAEATDNLQQLRPTDLFIIAVSDSAISEIAKKLTIGEALVVHTSGSTNINALVKFKNHGVLYPLQTFSKSRTEIDWENIPIFVEANSGNNLEDLKTLANILSLEVREANSNKRLQLHTAAVFACNFVNYLLTISADLSEENFKLLYPLVRETVEKAFASDNPREVQTGPAVRNDTITMEKQANLLPNELKELYQYISKLILSSLKNNMFK